MNSREVTLVSITVQELEDLVQRAVETGIENLLNKWESSCEQIQLISRYDASKLLKVSLPTLTKYVKQGRIPAHRIGNRILFKKNEIIESLIEVQNRKLFN